MARTAALLVIGNELLSGKVQDANTVCLARTLRSLGIDFRRVVTIPDELSLIAWEVNALRGTHDLLFTSGGIGPTHDDLTIAGVAAALGRRVVRSPEIITLLQDRLGETVTDGHLAMASVVEGTELYKNTDGLIPWPTMIVGNVYILPGVPEVFSLMVEGLVPRLRGDEAPFVNRSVLLYGDEGTLKPFIDAVVENFPDVSIGSYPRWKDPDYTVKVTFDGRDAMRVTSAAKFFVASVSPALVHRVE